MPNAMTKPAHAPFLALPLALSAMACSPAPGSSDAPPSALEPGAYSLPEGAARHDELLADLDQQIEALEAEAEAKPNSYMVLERLANAHARRGRLTGEVEDYTAAEAALAEAFARAGEGAGPFLSQAGVDFSLHRFAAAEAALDQAEERILIDDPTWAAIHGLRGDLRLQGGDVEQALELISQAEATYASPTTMSRLAQVRWRGGDYASAEAGYLESLARYHGPDASVRAWAHLQLGILDLERDDDEAALADFMAANAELSGYYLVEEHIAEVWVRLGRTEEALGLYLDVIDRTQSPEFMDAVASLHLEHGDPADAQPWIEQAAAAYEAQLAAHPDLAVGHALGHYIDFGPSARAVELAEANFALRPNGDARADRVRAYLADGRLDAALEDAEALAQGSWRTANTLGAVVEARVAAGLEGEPATQAVLDELCGLAPKAEPCSE
ncbi:hypothetical protein PPSIR1_12158 [Plesiocystis pacifica SIR-1]|uniref:Tetratricopeptide repeat protein n=2 Tax=Plesiocystis pacifica TaxID=191768 RepID=A6G5W1_9BACT|nr:hypothetical protein PPSIR1_12158 [Plesiocystis pacifica SIR-1]